MYRNIKKCISLIKKRYDLEYYIYINEKNKEIFAIEHISNQLPQKISNYKYLFNYKYNIYGEVTQEKLINLINDFYYE